jgi:carboxymethylenebutenolidase
MCYSDEARPPDHGLDGPVAAAEDLVLAAADGNRLAAHLVRPVRPNGAGVVILPDVRGLHNFYKALARRFAEAGVDAIAIDYFGRTAGISNRGDDFDWQSHVQQTTAPGVAADVGAALDHLRSLGDDRLFTVGFCFGGANSWRQSAAQPGLTGAIGFYGRPARVEDVVDEMKAPLLLLVAGADSTPRQDFVDFDKRLTEAGLPHQMVIYEGAPHSFFDRSYEQWQDACRDAWKQVLSFIAA